MMTKDKVLLIGSVYISVVIGILAYSWSHNVAEAFIAVVLLVAWWDLRISNMETSDNLKEIQIELADIKRNVNDKWK